MSLLLALEFVPPPDPPAGATKVGGDDAPRVEYWETRKAKKAARKIESRIEALAQAVPVDAPIALPVAPERNSAPDWTAYLAALAQMERDLAAVVAERRRLALSSIAAEIHAQAMVEAERRRAAEWAALLDEEDEELMLLL